MKKIFAFLILGLTVCTASFAAKDLYPQVQVYDAALSAASIAEPKQAFHYDSQTGQRIADDSYTVEITLGYVLFDNSTPPNKIARKIKQHTLTYQSLPSALTISDDVHSNVCNWVRQDVIDFSGNDHGACA